MKREMNVFLMIFVFVFMNAVSCNNGMDGGRGVSSNRAGKIDRSQRTVLDGAKYVDFTVRGVNAAAFTKQDVMYELNGTYRIAGGNSYITVDRSDGTVTISSDDAWDGESYGHNMYASYVFDVQAANEDCLYIKMGSKAKARMIMDYKALVNQEVPDLAVCLPLYGYSRNRIEISPVMNGYIAMPSGTYWAVKK
jgi:hypothetical protein